MANLILLTDIYVAVSSIKLLYPTFSAPAKREDLTPEEKKKYERIRGFMIEAAQKVGISNPESIQFRVSKKISSNACMVGSVAGLGGPVMCVANNFFTQFESPEILNDPKYIEWTRLLSELPDHPLELAEKLKSYSPETLSQIKTFTEKFNSVLTEEELKGIIAHELGHAKHLHVWKRIFLSAPFYWVARSVASVAEGLLTKLISFILLDIANNKITQIFEKEADSETNVSALYSTGIKSFFKKRVIQELVEGSNSSIEERAKQMIEGFDFFSSHPHPAKRVIAAINRKEEPSKPISYGEKTVALFGGAILAKNLGTYFYHSWKLRKKLRASPKKTESNL